MHLATPPAARLLRVRHRRLAVLTALTALTALSCLPAAASAAPLTVTTSPVDPTLTTDTYALLGGIVNPGGTAATYEFQWGPTTAYGQTTPVTPAGNGSADVPVDFSLDEIAPSTTYHYRLVAQAAGQPATANVYGADQTFKTSPALALKLVGPFLKVTKAGKAQITLEAVGPADDAAEGLLTIKSVVQGRAKVLTIVPYSVATGAKKTLDVRLPAAVRAALKARGPRPALSLSARTTGIKAPLVKTLKLVG